MTRQHYCSPLAHVPNKRWSYSFMNSLGAVAQGLPGGQPVHTRALLLLPLSLVWLPVMPVQPASKQPERSEHWAVDC